MNEILFCLPLCISVKSNVVAVSDVACMLEVELLAMAEVAAVVVVVVATLAV